uniref:Uncharacterized protein n=1 Tax=Catharus ustulatus TaxID=91951 RepID=A0A8C3U7R1_CATUS
ALGDLIGGGGCATPLVRGVEGLLLVQQEAGHTDLAFHWLESAGGDRGELQRCLAVLAEPCPGEEAAERGPGDTAAHEQALEELAELCESLDNATDFCSLGGLQAVLGLLGHPWPPLRSGAARVLGACAQNLPGAQSRALALGALPALLGALRGDPDPRVPPAALFAISCELGGGGILGIFLGFFWDFLGFFGIFLGVFLGFFWIFLGIFGDFFGWILGGFWVFLLDFGWILGGFGVDFVWILGGFCWILCGFLVDFWWILGDFGVDFGWFLLDFLWILGEFMWIFVGFLLDFGWILGVFCWIFVGFLLDFVVFWGILLL